MDGSNLPGRRIEPQDSAAELRPHPHRLTLWGTADSAAFPPLCPNCGSAATTRLTVAKVFRHTYSDDDPTTYTVTAVAVPYCDACIAAHRAQEHEPTLVETVMSGFATMEMLGAVFPAMGAVFLAWLALGDLAHARFVRCLVELGIGAVFAGIAWLQYRAVWAQTAHFRVPPLSPVTEAFDFSDGTAPAFESARFVCTIRDAGFASAFAALNAGQAFDRSSGRAVSDRARSTRKMWIVGGVVAVIALWGLLSDLFG